MLPVTEKLLEDIVRNNGTKITREEFLESRTLSNEDDKLGEVLKGYAGISAEEWENTPGYDENL